MPTANFVTHKISNNQAVLFGGAEDDGTGVTSSNNVYILKISFDTVVHKLDAQTHAHKHTHQIQKIHIFCCLQLLWCEYLQCIDSV